MRRIHLVGVLLGCMAWCAPAVLATQGWQTLQTGVEYRVFDDFGPAEVGDRRLHVVRIDPRRARLRLRMVSRDGGKARSAASWCRDSKLSVAINAGMFQWPLPNVLGVAAQ